MVDKIIENNKRNELFRSAWKELIDESSTEFEELRVQNLREKVKQSRETQMWKSIVVPSPSKMPSREQTESGNGFYFKSYHRRFNFNQTKEKSRGFTS